jgi:hypothetical protein
MPEMATTATKKPRTSVESIPQLATLPERVAVLEVKVTNIDEKMDNLKEDLCSNHNSIIDTLKEMRETSVAQHTDMANKIKDLEGFKNKWIWMTMGGIAVLGFLSGHAETLLKIFVK